MKMRTCFAVAATFIAVNCAAGLFDAVKNVAGGVVGMGNSCQATMPSGVNCKNAPVDGSSYCMQHKCRMCNELTWSDGLCRNCVPKAEAKAKAERQSAIEAEKMRRTKAEERSRLGRSSRSRNANATADARGRRGQTRRRRSVQAEAQCDERPFAGLKLGMIAPFGKEKGEIIKLKNAYLSIFEQVRLTYGKNSHLLNEIAFGSIPIHASNDAELQPYFDEVLSGLKALGYDMKRDMSHRQRPWRCKGDDYEIGLLCNDIRRTSDGVVDTHKQLVLFMANPKARQQENQYAAKVKSGDGIVHEVVPYVFPDGRKAFLHYRSGAIYSVTTNEGGMAYCTGTEESIVKRNGGVLKLPRKVSHGAGLEAQGEYPLSPYSIGALRLQSEKTTNVVDLTEFEAGDLSNATALVKACSSGFRIVLADQAVSARWLAELAAHTSRPFACFLGTDEVSGRQQVTKALTSCEKDFQFPADGICSDHPLLYKELASGASKDWCRIWLAINAKSYREYNESLDDDLMSLGERLKKGEIEAEVGGHEIILSFSESRNILVSVKCKFKEDGVSKDALIAKYKALFGDATTVETKDGGIRADKTVSSLPRTRKQQRELNSMSMSNSRLARTVARVSNEFDPFGEATLHSPAKIYYQRKELLEISGPSVVIQTHCDSFVKCAFLSNINYNRLAENGRLGLIDDCEKVPADAIIDENCESKIVNDSCGDELRGSMGRIKETINKLRAKDGKIFEIMVTGLALQNALSAEMQKRAEEYKAKEDVKRKKKEADSLNF